MQHIIRLLRPGREAVIGDLIEQLTHSPGSRQIVAEKGTAEAVYIEGLSHDELHVIEREWKKRSGTLVANSEGTCALLLGPLKSLGDLPVVLASWGPATQCLGDELGTVLMLRAGGGHTVDIGSEHTFIGHVPLCGEDSDMGTSFCVGTSTEQNCLFKISRLNVATELDSVRSFDDENNSQGYVLEAPETVGIGNRLRALQNAKEKLLARGISVNALMFLVWDSSFDDPQMLFRHGEYVSLGRPLVARCCSPSLIQEQVYVMTSIANGVAIVIVTDMTASKEFAVETSHIWNDR